MHLSYIRSFEEFQQILPLLRKESKIGFDIEYSSLDYDAKLAGFSFYLPSENKAFYVPLYHPKEENGTDLSSKAPEFFSEFLDLPLVTFNGSTDLGKIYYLYGIKLKAVGDAYIAIRMLQIPFYSGLKALASYLQIVEDTLELKDVLGVGNYDFTEAKLDQTTLRYTCQDAILAVHTEEKLLELNLDRKQYPDWDSVYALEMKVMPILGRMEHVGISINLREFKTVIEILKKKEETLHKSILKELKREDTSLGFNLASTQRLSAALFNKPDHVPQPQKKGQHKDLQLPGLGLHPGTSKTKSGGFSTSIENLKIIEESHPVISDIIEWKSLNSILTKDLTHVVEWVQNGVIRPRFVQIGADGTSRIYAEDKNIISLSKAVRHAIRPKPNRALIHMDFKAAEWRIAALFTGDMEILNFLDAGGDPHYLTYHRMTDKPIDTLTKEERDVGKTLNYGVLFGTEGFAIARQLRSTREHAVGLLDLFWKKHPALETWVEQVKSRAKKTSRTQTVIGRVRKLVGLRDPNERVRKQALRQAVNTACQGSCGDLLKMAMVNISEASQQEGILKKYNLEILCPVFDALLVEVDIEALQDKDKVEEELLKHFGVEISYRGVSTKMTSDIGWSSTSWLEATGKTLEALLS